MPKLGVMFQWLLIVSCMLIVGLPAKVLAHEFWIQPEHFQLQAGEQLIANIRVGENMLGDALYYLPRQFQSFNLHHKQQTTPITSRMGDLPAVNQRVNQAGLHILAYVSTDRKLTYHEPEKFIDFLEYEGIGWVKQAHQTRGLPASGFSEAYQRFAKALIQVGRHPQQDRPLGLRFELVLLTNPYTQKDRDIQVQLLWENKPFPHAQINMFNRRNNQTKRVKFTTDKRGIIKIPRQDAKGVYLLNAVHMIEPPANLSGIAWKSLWASTTFAVN